MKSNGDDKHLIDDSPKEANNIIKSDSNLLLFLKYLSNPNNNSPYENGGTKNKIPIEQLLSEIGPFLLTEKIDLLNISFLDYELDINRFSNFLLFIISNPEINYGDDNIKQFLSIKYNY